MADSERSCGPANYAPGREAGLPVVHRVVGKRSTERPPVARCRIVELEEYEYRDPGQVVSDVLARESVHEGDVVLALVYEPATTQSVIHTIRLSPEPWESISGYVRARMLADIARSMPVPPWQPGKFPRHSIMTIVFRRGFAVIGAGECEWLIGWRYSNHGVHAFSGDLTVVTEHGWFDFMSGLGGRQPRFDILQGRVA